MFQEISSSKDLKMILEEVKVLVDSLADSRTFLPTTDS
jgi:hypothetical protein